MKLGRAFLCLLTSLAILPTPAFAQAQIPCATEIGPLRDAVEKDALAVKAAVDRKAERAVVCTQMKRFAASEAKFVKYLEANQSWCSVPAEAMKQVKANHANTLRMRGQACAAAPPGARQGPPPGPGLSEALGTSRAPVVDDTKADRGTYNTLTGNPLQR